MKYKKNKTVNKNSRKIPYSIDIEKGILSGMINDDNCLSMAILDGISEYDFFDPKHCLIFRALMLANKNNLSINPIILFELIQEMDRNKSIKEIKELYLISNEIPTIRHIKSYIHILKQKSLLRQLILSANKITDLAYSEKTEAIEIIDKAEEIILEIRKNNIKKNSVKIKTIVNQTLNKIQKMIKQQKTVFGLSSGIGKFDISTNGLHGGELIIIAARPSMGKTALSLAIAAHISFNLNKGVAFFSMEMSAEQIVYRLMSMQSEIQLQQIRSGIMNSNQIKKLFDIGEQISTAPLYIDDSPGLTILSLRSKCRRLIHKYKVKLIIVDYLQLMCGAKNYDNKTTEISDISKGLKALAKEFNIPVIAISQLNRSVESRNDKRPVISDLRESGAIEQDADIIGLLYREEYYRKKHTPLNLIGKCEFIISKNRNGPTCTAWLNFNAKITKFYDSLEPKNNEYEKYNFK